MNFYRTSLGALGLLFSCTTAIYAETSGDAKDHLVEAQLVEDIGASERVEAAALLRVLSQEVSSAACHMSHDIDLESSRKLLLETKVKFGAILDALQYGNPDMNIIGAEERRKTVLQIEALREQWSPMYDAAITLLDDPKNEAALKYIKANNEAVLESTSALTSQLAGQYSNPAELLQVDVILLDFAARQAMLTQKMAKIGCEIWVGNRTDDRVELLTSTMQIYDLTLTALLDGMPAAGIIPAPTPEIKAALTQARTAWTKTRAELEAVLAGDGVTDELKTALYNDLNDAMYEMEHIEHLYVVYSKHDYKSESDPLID